MKSHYVLLAYSCQHFELLFLNFFTILFIDFFRFLEILLIDSSQNFDRRRFRFFPAVGPVLESTQQTSAGTPSSVAKLV